MESLHRRVELTITANVELKVEPDVHLNVTGQVSIYFWP